MSKKFTLAVLAFFVLMPFLNAAYLRCRSGVILSAEITRRNTPIFKWEPLAFNNLPAQKAFAAVSIKLDNMRNISIFDYSLEINNVSYPCVAIFRDNRFEYFTEEMNSTEILQMLFIVDASTISGSKIRARLKSNLAEYYVYETEFFCKIIGNSPLTDVKKIPANGVLEFQR